MAFFNSAINILGTLVVALGGGVCAWGGINLLEGYRAAARAEKQLDKANIHALQKKAEVEHPTSSPLSRWRQKQAIQAPAL